MQVAAGNVEDGESSGVVLDACLPAKNGLTWLSLFSILLWKPTEHKEFGVTAAKCRQSHACNSFASFQTFIHFPYFYV